MEKEEDEITKNRFDNDTSYRSWFIVHVEINLLKCNRFLDVIMS